jgi:hypothetical protein
MLTDEKRPLMARIYSLIYMAGYSAQLLLLLLLLVQVPLIYFNYQPPGSVVLLGLLGIGQPALYFLGQSTLYESWWRRLFHFPTLLLLAIGIAPAVSRAILQAVFKTNHVFVRTPKGNYARLPNHRSDSAEAHSYRLSGDWIVLLELLIALYAAAGLVLSIWQQNYGSAFFMATSMIGLGYVGLSTLNELR